MALDTVRGTAGNKLSHGNCPNAFLRQSYGTRSRRVVSEWNLLGRACRDHFPMYILRDGNGGG